MWDFKDEKCVCGFIGALCRALSGANSGDDGKRTTRAMKPVERERE